ncbi:hypothetical protein DBR06_SOUSAS13310023, partial [Sousa chinensis]
EGEAKDITVISGVEIVMNHPLLNFTRKISYKKYINHYIKLTKARCQEMKQCRIKPLQ